MLEGAKEKLRQQTFCPDRFTINGSSFTYYTGFANDQTFLPSVEVFKVEMENAGSVVYKRLQKAHRWRKRRFNSIQLARAFFMTLVYHHVSQSRRAAVLAVLYCIGLSTVSWIIQNMIVRDLHRGLRRGMISK